MRIRRFDMEYKYNMDVIYLLMDTKYKRNISILGVILNHDEGHDGTSQQV